MDRLAGKVAIVTGAGTAGGGWGNGKATAVLFAREGAKVLACDLDPAAAAETRAVIEGEGGDCTAFAGDVSKAEDVAAMVKACLDAYGRIDILHNNVGIGSLGTPVEESEEHWDRVYAVNVKSMFLTCKAVLPVMVGQGGGAIVNVSSVGGIRHVGIPYVAYASSKGAVNMFTRSVALDYAARGIRCNAILPGLMDTPMVRNQLMKHYGDVDRLIAERDRASPTGRMGSAWDVAYAALFLASDEAAYVNGVELPVDGGISARCV